MRGDKWGARARPWTVEGVQELLSKWSILSLEREADASGFVNILAVAQPKEEIGRR